MGINYIFEPPKNEGDYFRMSYVGGEVILTPTKRLKDTEIPTLTKKEAAALRVQQREERRLLKIQENTMPTHTPKEVAKKKKKTSKATPKKTVEEKAMIQLSQANCDPVKPMIATFWGGGPMRKMWIVARRDPDSVLNLCPARLHIPDAELDCDDVQLLGYDRTVGGCE